MWISIVQDFVSLPKLPENRRLSISIIPKFNRPIKVRFWLGGWVRVRVACMYICHDILGFHVTSYI